MRGLTDAEYRALADFRYELRRFLHFSERAARSAGLEPQQHQMLLALKGMPEGERATIGILAERLQIAIEALGSRKRRPRWLARR